MRKFGKYLIWVAVYLAFCVMAFVVLGDGLGYMEQQQTFYFDKGFFSSISRRFCGLSILLSSFFVQFFRDAKLGSAIVALLLLLTSILCSNISQKVSKGRAFYFIAFVPSIAIAFQLCDPDYHFYGFISFILMLCTIALTLRIESFRWRAAAGIVFGLLLYFAAGPIALLYAISLLIIEAFTDPGHLFYFVPAPIIVIGVALLSLSTPLVGEVRHALAPGAYYSLYLKLPANMWFSWGIWILCIALCGFLGRMKSRNVKRGLQVAAELVLLVLVFLGGKKIFYFKENHFYTEISQMARRSEWDSILSKCSNEKKYNVLIQNYVNLALSEKGLLDSKLFDFPLSGPQSLFVETNDEPYVTVLLTDVFFSMGEIGLSQRYAFEANEAWGGYSPYCLQRLVLTNILFGNHSVARKYLALLHSSPFYRKWAEYYTSVLDDGTKESSDKYLAYKKDCLNVPNALSGLHIDDDLKNIIRANPAHRQTIQYLAALYLLNCDLASFIDMLDEFYGTPALPQVLPPVFQQAVMLYAGDDISLLMKYHISESTQSDYKRFINRPASRANTFWAYYFSRRR